MKMLIATHNPGKIREMGDILRAAGHETVSLTDLEITADVDESEPTFYGNAKKKARFFCELTGLPTIAEDGGLEIVALNGEPGVHTRRWDGSERMDDARLLKFTLEKLKGLADRRATLVSVVVFAFIESGFLIKREEISGIITEEQLAPIIPGYPFRSIFIVNQLNKLFADLTDEEHQLINHRRKATTVVANLLK